MTVPSHIPIRACGDFAHSCMPRDNDGHTYFLGLKEGEVANRILFVDSVETAQRIAKTLDGRQGVFESASNMGFTIISGTKYKYPISILVLGSGLANMDAAMREIRTITKGPLQVMYFGTSYSSLSGIAAGTVVLASQSLALQTNYGARSTDMLEKRFSRSAPLSPDKECQRILRNHLEAYVKPSFSFSEATSVTVDTVDARNALQKLQPESVSFDMKTHYLYDLAKRLKIQAVACSIVQENILDKTSITHEQKLQLEEVVAKSCIQTLAKLPVDS